MLHMRRWPPGGTTDHPRDATVCLDVACGFHPRPRIQMVLQCVGRARETKNGGINVKVEVDGDTYRCHFTSAALKRIDPPNRDMSALHQFRNNQIHLLSVAMRKILLHEVDDREVRIEASDLVP
jgi:hypothetical protein